MSAGSLEAGIYSKLTADSGAGGVATLATGGIYNTQAKPRATLPLVIFNVSDDGIPQRFSGDVIDAEFTVEVIADKELGITPVNAIVDRLFTLLDNDSITISGYNGGNVQCLNRGQAITDVDVLRNVSVYHVHANT